MSKKTHISRTTETKEESGIYIQSSSPEVLIPDSIRIDPANDEIYFEQKNLRPELSPVTISGNVIDITNTNNITVNVKENTTLSFVGNENGRSVTVILKNMSDLFFEGRVAGMTSDIVLKTSYSRLSEIFLLADGTKTINNLISEYNSKTPLNPIVLVSGNGDQAPVTALILKQKQLEVNFNGVYEIINNNNVLETKSDHVYVFNFISGLIFGELKLNVNNKFIQQNSGLGHSLALKADGRVFAWGSNEYSQLGDSTTINRSFPVQVVGQSDFVAISAGESHSLALKADGRVFSWGNNLYGQLGDGTTIDKSSPVQIINQSDFVAISAGHYHSLALKADGRVFAWGANSQGILGDGTITTKSSPVQVINQSDFVAISAGLGHSLALKADGRVFAWGGNGFGSLGTNTPITFSVSPVQVVGQSDFIAISAENYHSLALKADGRAFTWGINSYGNLGDGTTINKSSPVQVINQSDFVAISGGSDHSLALKADGRVFAWGWNSNGQLGNGLSGSTAHRSSPVQVINESDFVAISAENYYSLALKADGRVFAWGNNIGNNIDGRLGDGTIINRSSPVQVVKI